MLKINSCKRFISQKGGAANVLRISDPAVSNPKWRQLTVQTTTSFGSILVRRLQ
jgi:hypothetical protein